MSRERHLIVEPVTPDDYRELARRRLPRFLFDYVDGAANHEQTAAANVADFEALKLRQRVLRDVGSIDTTTSLLGRRIKQPVVLAPVGMAGLFARRGEVQAVRAADAAGIPFTLSTVGICPLAEVRAAATAPFWFQLYMIRDRGAVRDLVTQAADTGCDTLVFTVDLPLTGMRHRDLRNGMLVASGAGRRARLRALLSHPGWLWDVGVKGRPHSFGNLARQVADPTDMQAFRRYVSDQFDPTVTWRDIEWLRSIWPGRLVLKGIMEVDDARQAVAVGADGLVVSNHGGRQLDGVASGIVKLPAIAEAVGDQTDILMDGGVRSGIDVYRALALGAKAVMVGRPWIWALAARGEAGVSALLATFEAELRVAMALTGMTTIAAILPDALDR